MTTAVPLTPALRAGLAEALAKFTGKTPDLIERVDPAILGGLVVEVGGEKIDSSLSNQLHDAGLMLAQRAAQELHHRGGSRWRQRRNERRREQANGGGRTDDGQRRGHEAENCDGRWLQGGMSAQRP